LTRPKVERCFGQCGKAVGPVIATTGIGGDVFVLEVHLGAVTVGLDFVEPPVSRWGIFPKRRIAEFDESRVWEDGSAYRLPPALGSLLAPGSRRVARLKESSMKLGRNDEEPGILLSALPAHTSQLELCSTYS
jgi:hypothetical protein